MVSDVSAWRDLDELHARPGRRLGVVAKQPLHHRGSHGLALRRSAASGWMGLPVCQNGLSPLANPFPVRGMRQVGSRRVRVTQHDVCEAYAALLAYEGPAGVAVSTIAARFGLSAPGRLRRMSG